MKNVEDIEMEANRDQLEKEFEKSLKSGNRKRISLDKIPHVLSFVLLSVFLFACTSQRPLFNGDFSSLAEGNEIRMQGILEKNFSKTGSYEYRVNGVWMTFDDDRVIADDFVGKTVMVKGTVHHFNNCPSRQDPDMPEQCAIAEQLRVIEIQ